MMQQPDNLDTNELVLTIIDQAHTIRRLSAHIAQLEREIAAHEALQTEHAAEHSALASAAQQTDTQGPS